MTKSIRECVCQMVEDTEWKNLDKPLTQEGKRRILELDAMITASAIYSETGRRLHPSRIKIDVDEFKIHFDLVGDLSEPLQDGEAT